MTVQLHFFLLSGFCASFQLLCLRTKDSHSFVSSFSAAVPAKPAFKSAFLADLHSFFCCRNDCNALFVLGCCCAV